MKKESYLKKYIIFIMKYKEKIEAALDYNRDFNFDYFWL